LFPAPPILKTSAAPSNDNKSQAFYPSTNAPCQLPIQVDKTKGHRKINNVFVNDCGFPDVSDEFDTLLHNIDGGPVFRKLKQPPPDPDGLPDPLFSFAYDKAQHGPWLHKQLNLSHLVKLLRDRIYALVIKYWSLFDEHGVFVPVRH
jgi:hypothetical protein